MMDNRFFRPYGAAWLPTDMSNLAAWFDPSDTDTVTDDGGGACSRLANKAGNSVPDLTATTTLRPTTGTRTINGLNVLDFNGTSNGMDANWDAEAINAPTMMYVVANADAWAANSTLIDAEPATANLRQILRATSATVVNIWANGASANVGTWAVSTDTIFGAFYNAGSSWGRINGTQVGGTVGANAQFEGMALGHNTSAGERWDGRIGEVIIVESATDDQKTLIESYLSDKWGIAV